MHPPTHPVKAGLQSESGNKRKKNSNKKNSRMGLDLSEFFFWRSKQGTPNEATFTLLHFFLSKSFPQLSLQSVSPYKATISCDNGWRSFHCCTNQTPKTNSTLFIHVKVRTTRESVSPFPCGLLDFYVHKDFLCSQKKLPGFLTTHQSPTPNQPAIKSSK